MRVHTGKEQDKHASEWNWKELEQNNITCPESKTPKENKRMEGGWGLCCDKLEFELDIEFILTSLQAAAALNILLLHLSIL